MIDQEPPEPGTAETGDTQPLLPMEQSGGDVRIDDDVVGVIAALAASEVEGVAGMAGGLVGGIGETLLGRRHLAKGVKAEVGEREAALDLSLLVEYGVRIPDVAQRVQEAVKRAVESMTGLKVKAVDVHVQGVSSPDDHPGAETGGPP